MSTTAPARSPRRADPKACGGAGSCHRGDSRRVARPEHIREAGVQMRDRPRSPRRVGAGPKACVGAGSRYHGDSRRAARPEHVRGSGSRRPEHVRGSGSPETRVAAAGVSHALRLFTAQHRWLGTPAVIALALGLAALPLALAWLARAQILTTGQLLTGLLHVAERYLPLWALVAGGALWADAEPEHRPLLLTWPLRSWTLALAKLAAAGLAYALLAGGAALGLPALFAHAAGGSAPAPPGGLLFIRALLPGLTLLALASIGGAPGGPWAGTGLGAALWFANLLEPSSAWLDSATAGLFNLFALTRGSAVALEVLNRHQALAALALLALALGAPGLARRMRQGRFGFWHSL
jgi:hypothetical protein